MNDLDYLEDLNEQDEQAEQAEKMKNYLESDYFYITNLVDTLKKEIDIERAENRDPIHEELALNAYYLFSNIKSFVNVACDTTYVKAADGIAHDTRYKNIKDKIRYMHAFVNGLTLGGYDSKELKDAANGGMVFGCWRHYTATDEIDVYEFMQKLADMLRPYVADNEIYSANWDIHARLI